MPSWWAAALTWWRCPTWSPGLCTVWWSRLAPTSTTRAAASPPHSAWRLKVTQCTRPKWSECRPESVQSCKVLTTIILCWCDLIFKCLLLTSWFYFENICNLHQFKSPDAEIRIYNMCDIHDQRSRHQSHKFCLRDVTHGWRLRLSTFHVVKPKTNVWWVPCFPFSQQTECGRAAGRHVQRQTSHMGRSMAGKEAWSQKKKNISECSYSGSEWTSLSYSSCKYMKHLCREALSIISASLPHPNISQKHSDLFICTDFCCDQVEHTGQKSLSITKEYVSYHLLEKGVLKWH